MNKNYLSEFLILFMYSLYILSGVRIEIITKLQLKKILEQRGFTLIEILAILIILGILTAVVVPRFIDLESGAKQKAIDAAIGELNGRENLTWSNLRISDSGYIDDSTVFSSMDYTLGSDYTWNPGEPTAAGGTINFKGVAVNLIRIVSEASKPANWERPP